MRAAARIAPSILAADFASLGEAVALIETEVDSLHVDVMDGHFVPNISLGPPVIASLRASTSLHLDCHLMITDPVRYLESLKSAGADGVTAHIEAVPSPDPFLREAERLGLTKGIALNPSTPVEAVTPYLDRVDLVLVMSVQPGFGGQSFIEGAVDKIAALRESIDSAALSADIQVDGGVDLRTVAAARSAGADILVAGTAIFGAADPVTAIGELRSTMDHGSTQ